MPEELQMKLLKQYEGKSIGKALYALEIAELYMAQKILERRVKLVNIIIGD